LAIVFVALMDVSPLDGAIAQTAPPLIRLLGGFPSFR
jgi:hypothetical protein